MTTKFLIQRDGRQYIMDSVPDWAVDNSDYKVEKLSTAVTSESVQAAIEEVKLLQEIYSLDELEIANLKAKLEEFVELVEAIVDIAVPTENFIENKAKLLLINESCKKILAPSVEA